MLVVVSNDLLGLLSFLLPVFSFIIWKIFNRFEKAILLKPFGIHFETCAVISMRRN